MADELDLIHSTKIKIEDGLEINKRDMTEYINSAGIKMLKYEYRLVKTKNGDYKIGDPNEFARIAKALNSPDVRFVKINNDLVNIATIEVIKEQIGYRAIEE